MTTQKAKFKVSPAAEGWTVDRDGAGKPLATFKTKEEAVDYATKMAKVEQPSQIVVQGQDGTVETEQAFTDKPTAPE
jgi:hypothetical protein